MLLTGIITGNQFVLGRFLWNYPLLKDVLDSDSKDDAKLDSAIDCLRVYAKDKKHLVMSWKKCWLITINKI
jgi:hypothetical protein